MYAKASFSPGPNSFLTLRDICIQAFIWKQSKINRSSRILIKDGTYRFNQSLFDLCSEEKIIFRGNPDGIQMYEQCSREHRLRRSETAESKSESDASQFAPEASEGRTHNNGYSL